MIAPMSALPRYRPSGRTSILLLPLGLLAVVLGVAIAWPYQALVTWVPYIYINLLVVIGFAIALGVLAYLASNYGKNRNRWLGALLGLVIGVSAVGATHYFAYRRAIGEVMEEAERIIADEGGSLADVGDLSELMPTFSQFIKLKTESGWSLGRSSSDGKGDLTGIFVWLIWGIEALGLIGVAIYGGRKLSPYCETCNTPLPEQTYFTRSDLHLDDIGVITDARSVAQIVSIPPRPQVSEILVTFAGHTCGTCSGDTYLTVTQSWTEGDETKTAELHEDVVMTRAEREQLIGLGQQLQSG